MTNKKSLDKKKQCESCQHFGKGECDYITCTKTSYSGWEEIKKPKSNNSGLIRKDQSNNGLKPKELANAEIVANRVAIAKTKNNTSKKKTIRIY